jgi:hypothetical protein
MSLHSYIVIYIYIYFNSFDIYISKLVEIQVSGNHIFGHAHYVFGRLVLTVTKSLNESLKLVHN